MGETTRSPGSCASCGRPLPPGARFCRACGASAQAGTVPTAAPAPPPEKRQGGPWKALAIVLLVVLVAGAGVAGAFLLLGDEKGEERGPSPGEAATVPAVQAPSTESGEADSAAGGETGAAPTGGDAAPGSLAAGRYVQAGSFRTPEGAEGERERLAAEGIEVEVIESDQAQELYPGFQVLLGGPLGSTSAERSLLKRLHDNGVPSAYARPLSPARAISGPEAVAGEWTGVLERSGTDRPRLNGALRSALRAAGDGSTARLEFPALGCSVDLSLVVATAATLSYRQEGECVGAGEWRLRPEEESVALTLLPPDDDTIVVGNLSGT